MDSQITSIGQIAITVKDLARAVAFYRDVAGLRYLFEAGGMAFFDCGGTRLMLTLPEGEKSTYSSIIYYKTADIEASASAMRDRGAQFEALPRMIAKMPDHDLWMAFLRDTEGNLLALMSEVRTGTMSEVKTDTMSEVKTDTMSE
jgi:methylmalonyl-CoA/ethylmalonyl-CoA epimerase